MRLTWMTSALLLTTVLTQKPAQIEGDALLEELATCRASWQDWRNDPVQGRKFADVITGTFTQQPRGPAWTPKRKVVVAGMPVVEAFPESVGMGVGFSLTVEANFDKARQQLEKAAGKTFKDCEAGEGMRTCEFAVAEKRTLIIIAGDNGKAKTSLIGCYYFYAR